MVPFLRVNQLIDSFFGVAHEMADIPDASESSESCGRIVARGDEREVVLYELAEVDLRIGDGDLCLEDGVNITNILYEL